MDDSSKTLDECDDIISAHLSRAMDAAKALDCDPTIFCSALMRTATQMFSTGLALTTDEDEFKLLIAGLQTFAMQHFYRTKNDTSKETLQ
jgi:hypothetical protein